MNSSNPGCASLRSVQTAMADAAQSSGRNPDEVLLLAVSKGQPVAAIRALAACGQRRFAESYVQEALEKQQALDGMAHSAAGAGLEWHFIGPIQSNKTRKIAESFDWVHSVDRLKIATRLSAQRPSARPSLRIFIEVNIDREAGKSGVLPEDAAELVRACQTLPRLQVVGLMAIPAPRSVEGFARLAVLNAQLPEPLPLLSMGMSDDFPEAIAAGSTHVRIGTALFGARMRPPVRAEST